MNRTVTKRPLGKHGPTVSSIGLGAMGMSDLYGKTGALDVELGPSDVEQIERTVPPGAAAVLATTPT
jgi:aryl-alcohol dehydrogenase-like predicted oxidoreductase